MQHFLWMSFIKCTKNWTLHRSWMATVHETFCQWLNLEVLRTWTIFFLKEICLTGCRTLEYTFFRPSGPGPGGFLDMQVDTVTFPPLNERRQVASDCPSTPLAHGSCRMASSFCCWSQRSVLSLGPPRVSFHEFPGMQFVLSSFFLSYKVF